jgi:hypothetical protein
MGTAYNAAIVSDSLALVLDAGNPRSYPGTGTAWYDLSGLGNHFTLNNTPTYNTSNGGLLTFSGGSHAVNTASAPTLAVAATTHSVWFRTTTVSAGYQLLYGSSGQPKLYLNGQAVWLYQVGGSTGNVIAINTWYNVTATSDTTGTRYYLNGALIYTQGAATWSTTPATYKVGQDPSGSSQSFSGSIPVVHVYRRALTENEVLQNFSALRGRYGI